MTIQAYVDETGSNGKGPLFLFSALLGTAFDWAAISDQWQAALDESPRIRYFKMDEAADCDGEFRRLSDAERDAKLKRLAQAVTAEFPIIEHTVTADLETIKNELVPQTRKPFNSLYFWPFQITIGTIGLLLVYDGGSDEPFEITFDNHYIFGPRAEAWYPVMREMAEPRLRQVLPMRPRFADDVNEKPLQIADLTAWLQRADRTGDGRFCWVRDHLRVSRGPTIDFDKATIAALYDRTTPVPAERQWKVEAARRVFNERFVKGGAWHYGGKPPKRKRS